MDIQILGNDSLKIKSKKTTLALDPKSSISKFDADAVLLIEKDSSSTARIDNYRVIIDSPGEYEISGLKISGIKSEKDIMFALSLENVSALIAKASSLKNIPADKIGEYKIAVINVDAQLDQSVVTSMEPSVVILYGEKAKEGAKILGKDSPSSSSKISISEEKLPDEMDVMLLS